jgi:uncharacterized protein (DUF433 family)
MPARMPYIDRKEVAHKFDEGQEVMAALDWSRCPAVESITGKVSGAWVFKDTRMPVSLVFENLEVGATIDEITEWFHLTREQIVAVLEFAARSLDPPPSPSQSGASAVHTRPL